MRLRKNRFAEDSHIEPLRRNSSPNSVYAINLAIERKNDEEENAEENYLNSNVNAKVLLVFILLRF